LADFRLAKDLVLGADMTTSLSTCMCSCRTRFGYVELHMLLLCMYVSGIEKK
jgi:hypothetical protein